MSEDAFIQDILISTKTQELDVGKNLIDTDWQKNNQLTVTLHDSQITKTLSKPLPIFSCAPYLGPPKPLWLILVSQSLTQPYDLKVNFIFSVGTNILQQWSLKLKEWMQLITKGGHWPKVWSLDSIESGLVERTGATTKEEKAKAAAEAVGKVDNQ